MAWADNYIAKLQKGTKVTFCPRGNSMSGIIESGDQVTIRPIKKDELPAKGDVVLCKVKGNQCLHLVKATEEHKALIANNFGHVNGWTSTEKIYGIVTEIVPKGELKMKKAV